MPTARDLKTQNIANRYMASWPPYTKRNVAVYRYTRDEHALTACPS